MMDINTTEIPHCIEEDMNPGRTTWRNGRLVSFDTGREVIVYIGHQDETQTDEAGNERTVTRALPITVEKPLSRCKIINAAEMQAYHLTSALEVASFQASLARKSRSEDDTEVAEHDDYIGWVKCELNKIGFLAPGKSPLDAARENKLYEIAQYNKSDQVDSFTLHGKEMWLKPALRVNVDNSTRQAILKGLPTTTLWYDGVRYELPVEMAQSMLADLELYALECYNVTNQHLLAVEKLDSIEAIEAYDHTKGYPPKLTL